MTGDDRLVPVPPEAVTGGPPGAAETAVTESPRTGAVTRSGDAQASAANAGERRRGWRIVIADNMRSFGEWMIERRRQACLLRAGKAILASDIGGLNKALHRLPFGSDDGLSPRTATVLSLLLARRLAGDTPPLQRLVDLALLCGEADCLRILLRFGFPFGRSDHDRQVFAAGMQILPGDRRQAVLRLLKRYSDSLAEQEALDAYRRRMAEQAPGVHIHPAAPRRF